MSIELDVMKILKAPKLYESKFRRVNETVPQIRSGAPAVASVEPEVMGTGYRAQKARAKEILSGSMGSGNADEFVRASETPEGEMFVKNMVIDMLVNLGLNRREAADFIERSKDMQPDELMAAVGELKGGQGKIGGAEQNLLEGVGSARKAFVETKQISEQDFAKLLEKDPTPQKKYIDWMAKVFVKEHMRVTDVEKFNDVARFEELVKRGKIDKQNRDVYQIETLEDLHDLISPFDNVDLTTADVVKAQAEAGVEGAKKVFENEKITVYDILSVAASKALGAQRIDGSGPTSWCTTASSADQYFTDYTDKKDGKLYYIIPKPEYASPFWSPENPKGEPGKIDKVYVHVVPGPKYEVGGPNYRTDKNGKVTNTNPTFNSQPQNSPEVQLIKQRLKEIGMTDLPE